MDNTVLAEIHQARLARRGCPIGPTRLEEAADASATAPAPEAGDPPASSPEEADNPCGGADSAGGGNADSSDTVVVDRAHLECPLCYRVFYKPISLSCGHTYCHPCVRRAAEASSSCPECRAPFPDDVASARRVNVALANIVHEACRSEVEEREHEMRTAGPGSPESEDVRLPVFVFPMLVFPNQPVQLHLFEPRYVALVNRCLSGSRRFAVQAGAGESQVGTVVEILQARYTTRGTYLVHGRGCGRYRAAGPTTVDTNAHGLHYVHAAPIHDEPPDVAGHDAALRSNDASDPAAPVGQHVRGGASGASTIAGQTDALRSALQRFLGALSESEMGSMQAAYGVMPDAANAESFSLWATSVLQMPEELRVRAAPSTPHRGRFPARSSQREVAQRELLFSQDTAARLGRLQQVLSAADSRPQAPPPLRGIVRRKHPCSSAPASCVLLLAVVGVLAVHHLLSGPL